MNLSIGQRIALPVSMILATVIGTYALVDLYGDHQRRILGLDQKLSIEAFVTADLIRLEPTDIQNTMGSRDVVEVEELTSPEAIIDVDVWKDSSLLYRRVTQGSKSVIASIALDPGVLGATSHRDGSRSIRMVQLTFRDRGALWIVRAAEDERSALQGAATLRRMVVVAVPFSVAIAVWLSYIFARRALKPLTDITRQTAAISAASLAYRIPMPAVDDEISQLAAELNQLLGRVQGAVNELSQFTANVSHELRTPLTVVRSVGESTLNSDAVSPPCRDAMSKILEEVDRITELLESLLLLARMEVDGRATLAEPFVPIALVEATCMQWRPLAELRRQVIAVHGAKTPSMSSDVKLIDLALTNVIQNAIKFAPEGSCIDIYVTCDASALTIAVEDTGPGIAANERDKVFERFYRADQWGSRRERGFGLGLSIAKAAISKLEGTIVARSSSSGGARMIIKVPIRDRSLL